MKTFAFICAFLFSVVCIHAHCLNAYKDTRAGSEKLYAVDNGKIIQLEYKVVSFKVGGTMIAFVNSAQEFKVYFNGETKLVQRSVGPGFSYFVNDNFVLYGNKIFDGSRSYEMCFFPRQEELSSLEDSTAYLERRKASLTKHCVDDI